MSKNYNPQTLPIEPQDLIIKKGNKNAYAEQYTTSLIIAGNRVEVKKYAFPMTRRYVDVRKRSTTITKQTVQEPATYIRRKDNINRARVRLTRLVHANIIQKPTRELSSRFLTLTYADQERALPQNHALHMDDIAKFMRKFKEKYGQQKYVYVTELTKKGRVHFHVILFSMVCNNYEDIADMWGHGTITIEQIKGNKKSISRIAGYLAKYICKDTEHVRMYQKFYRVSESLDQPVEVTDPDFIEQYLKACYDRAFVKTYKKEYDMPFLNNSLIFEIWEPAK